MLLMTAALVSACDKTPSVPASPPPDIGDPARAAEPGERELFRDVAARVGLGFRHFQGGTDHFYFPEPVGAGAALFDYDGDGDLDAYLLQGRVLEPGAALDDARFPPASSHWPGNRLFRNDLVPGGRLRFEDVTETAGLGYQGYGMGVAVGDYDNDSHPDLYITHFGANRLFHNEGDGTFADVTAAAGADDPRWSTSAAFVDYDRDGDLDLFVTNYVTFNLEHNKPCFGSNGQRDYCGPQSFDPVPDRLLRNDGDGHFSDQSAASGIDAAYGSGLGVTAADFDGDGWPDIYVGNDQRANQLWRNLGDGRFEEFGLMSGTAFNMAGAAEASMGVTAGDFDGDGDEDLFMTHLREQTNTLYVNDGQANFMDHTDLTGLGHSSMRYTGFGSQWLDFDNDGLLDLFVANGDVLIDPDRIGKSDYPYEQANQLFHNLGGGRFADVAPSAGAALQLLEVSRGAAFGDIDNDGDIDILVSNNNGPARLLLNQVGNRKHWLRLRLTGTTSNRDAAGARVALLRRDKPPLWRRAHTDGSYLSASDIRVHFGLGDSPVIDAIGVLWPSGLRERWGDIKADTQIELTEGSGEPWPAQQSSTGVFDLSETTASKQANNE